MITKSGLAVILVCICFSSFAGELNTKYVASIVNTAPSWAVILAPAMNTIFITLWFFETALQCVTKHFFELPRLKALARFLAVRIVFMSFFTYALMKPDFYLGIIQYLTKIGQSALGASAGGSGITGIDAGWIWQQYAQWHLNDYTPALTKLGLKEIGQQLSMAFGNIIYILCTCYLCFVIIMLEIQIYATLYGALILTAFAGSSWTKQWWNSYLGACVSLGIKVMLFCFLYAILQSAMTYKSGNIAGAAEVWDQIINSILCTLAIAIVPGKIAGMVSSSGSGDFGGEMVGTAMTAIAIGSKAGNMGLATLGASVSAPVKSYNAAKTAASWGKTAYDWVSGKGSGSGGTSGSSSTPSSQQPIANKTAKSEFLKNGKNR